MAVFLTLSFLGIVLLGARGVGERELACEETAVHLEDCCPDFDPSQITCSYEASFCGGPGAEPFFTVTEADCIRDLE